MRLAPVPIAFASLFPDGLPDLMEKAVESSLPTHGSPQCIDSCRYLTLVLCGLINGEDRSRVLSPDWPPAQWLMARFTLHPEVQEIIRGSYTRRRPPEICGSGYVMRSLEAALWAFHRAVDFREAVLKAVNLGDDADTPGAVCGQLAGAY